MRSWLNASGGMDMGRAFRWALVPERSGTLGMGSCVGGSETGGSIELSINGAGAATWVGDVVWVGDVSGALSPLAWYNNTYALPESVESS